MNKIFRFSFSFFLVFTFLVSSYASLEAAIHKDKFPLYLKYKFEKETGRKWYDASYERKSIFMKQVREEQKKVRIQKKKMYQRKVALEHRVQMRKSAKKRKADVRANKLKLRRERKRRKIQLRKDKAQRAKEKMFSKIREARDKSNRFRR